MKRLALTLLLALAVAGPSFAGAWSKGCTYSGGDLVGTVGTPAAGGLVVTASTTLPAGPPPGLGSVGDDTILCYRYTNTGVLADGIHNAGPFWVAAQSALILFDPQLDAVVSVATAALLTPHACAGGVLTLATPQFSCPTMGGMGSAAALDGVGGPDATQNAAKWIGPGLYYLELTACLAGDTCQVMIRGSR